MKQNYLVGTWQLVSAQLKDADNQISYPFGQEPIGYLMYNKDGYMFVSIMNANRFRFASKDIAGGSIEEMATAADTYASYCGKYETQVDKVIHHIEVSLYPNWIGVAQERIFELKGDRLLLSAPPDLIDGKQQTANFVWKRV